MTHCTLFLQSIFDVMHCADHGHSIHNLKYVIIFLLNLQVTLGLLRNELMHKIMSRVAMCMGKYKPVGEPTLRLDRKHDTLISLPNSVHKLFLKLTGLDKKKEKSSGSGPMVDANDVQLMSLMMPYVFHKIASDEVEQFNRGKRVRDHVQDPSANLCLVFTEHLRWYSRFRRPQNSTRSLGKLQIASKRYLAHIDKMFGPEVNGTVKIHWCQHGGGQIALLGDGQNGSTCPTERKHSDALKKKERNTNQHADTFGLSVLKNNRREKQARAMMQDLAGIAIEHPSEDCLKCV